MNNRLSPDKINHYNNICDVLKSSQIQSFEVTNVKCRDILIYLDFNLKTNVGTFEADDIYFANMFDLSFKDILLDIFNSGIGNILKDKLISAIENRLFHNEEPLVKYFPQ
jgi:hypothetical protein